MSTFETESEIKTRIERMGNIAAILIEYMVRGILNKKNYEYVKRLIQYAQCTHAHGNTIFMHCYHEFSKSIFNLTGVHFCFAVWVCACVWTPRNNRHILPAKLST